MTRGGRLAAWLSGFVVFVLLLFLLSDVLMPFVTGMAVAYFLDPVVDKLEEKGASRALAAASIIAAFFIAVVALLVLLFPLMQAQVLGLLGRIPDLVEALRDRAAPLLEQLQARLSEQEMERLGSVAGVVAGEAGQWIKGLLKGLWSGGMAVFSVVSLIVLTPLVSFYLLRDWDRIVALVDDYLPRDSAPTIRAQVAEIDRTIAGFARGQATVCLILAAFYGAGLTLVGLDFGLLVGFGTGLISFIPYFGMLVGFAVAFGIALAQFSEWTPIVLVAVVFAIGQVGEGYFLTPKLVGDRVGLHPVWVIFALLAGGSLFGFTGILLAVPAAAVIGVLVRFALARYRESRLYTGQGDSPS